MICAGALIAGWFMAEAINANAASVPAPVSSYVVEEPVETVWLEPLAPVVTPPPAPTLDAQLWGEETLASVGIATDVRILWTDVGNCGADISTGGMGGCTYTHEDYSRTIIMSPGLTGTDWGRHILFHEIGHTLGLDECGAEAYAHQFEVEPLWSYPECNPNQ
jgi:hypothetical protein